MNESKELNNLLDYLIKAIFRDSLYSHYQEVRDLLLTIDECNIRLDNNKIHMLLLLLSLYDFEDETMNQIIQRIKVFSISQFISNLGDFPEQPKTSLYNQDFFKE